jgi:membrane-associated phospholipid phosphatase
MHKVFVTRVALAIVLAVSPLSVVVAQSQPTSPDTTSNEPLFNGRDVIRAVGFTGLTIAMFPIDRSIARRLTNERSKANRFLNGASKGVELIADPGSIVIGSSLYVIGRLTNHPNIEDLGWHGTEAVIFASSITWILKGVTGRARPFATADTTAHDFKFGGGFGNADRQSFPSGHTTAAFAAASAVTSEAERMWPHHFWLVAPVMYGGASLVGLSRMYHDKHWASDVVLGAAVGTFSGLKIVRYSHTHPRNRLDRAILGLEVVPLPDASAGLALSFPAP